MSANIPGTAINGKVGQVAVMANILYDFMPTSVITPYIGAGAGIAFVDSNSSLGSTQFAYQGMLGVAYNVSEQLRFMVEGRYFGTTNPSVNTPFGNVSFQNQNILALVGVSYKFNAPPAAAAAGGSRPLLRRRSWCSSTGIARTCRPRP